MQVAAVEFTGAKGSPVEAMMPAELASQNGLHPCPGLIVAAVGGAGAAVLGGALAAIALTGDNDTRPPVTGVLPPPGLPPVPPSGVPPGPPLGVPPVRSVTLRPRPPAAARRRLSSSGVLLGISCVQYCTDRSLSPGSDGKRPRLPW